jgi:hypothetical protein
MSLCLLAIAYHVNKRLKLIELPVLEQDSRHNQ